MAPGALVSTLSSTLEKHRKEGRFFPAPDATAQVRAVDFGSSDYLSLSSDILRDELFRELNRHPGFVVGARGSRVLDTTGPYLEDLEANLARFHGARDALFFISGFDANVAVWSTIPQPGDAIVYDELVHASTREGMKLSRAKTKYAFQHNDVASLESVLQAVKQEHADIAQGTRSLFVAVETVYSMEGDVCPLAQLAATAKEVLPRADVVWVVDEAHSNGLYGPRGSGLVCHYGLEDDVAIRMHTFGKALGSVGAAVLCDPVVKVTLFNYARNFVYTTGPTFMDLAAVRAAYRLVQGAEGDMRAGKLRLVDPGGRLRDIISPIVPVVTQPGESRGLAAHLLRNGFLAHAVQYPIVPLESERLRIIVHANNTREQIEGCVEGMMQWARRGIMGRL
ncbi:aminotransferase [Ophiocordyceps sinensis CO18]|uniref:Aminotransferase n=1 Tax=Ophiocordyceps sinensis (strain Co18 / CGMCC 3.14243) TaxID=911162 RepID=T5AEG6_OPHSC|nr:aminotransferase [Ophiocordyceps sinensis CO18]